MSGCINTGVVACVTERSPAFWLVSVQSVCAGDFVWSKIATAQGDHHARMLKLCVCRRQICVACINGQWDFWHSEIQHDAVVGLSIHHEMKHQDQTIKPKGN